MKLKGEERGEEIKKCEEMIAKTQRVQNNKAENQAV